MTAVESWAEVGERIRQARVANRLSQARLAADLGVDRSALARVESGERHVSALELFRLSDLLHVPIGHFVSRPPAAVVSRRRPLDDDADAVEQQRFRLDAALEAYARDAEWLLAQDFLVQVEFAGASRWTNADDARAIAAGIRMQLGLSGPLDSLADVCGQAGLQILVVADLQAGASLLLDEGFGVAVIGGDDAPGRRRQTAAHELGHFILQDEHTSDVGVSAGRDARENSIDAFAAELLLPREELTREWLAREHLTLRDRLVWVAGTYRVSWSAVLRCCEEAGLIGSDEIQPQRSRAPGKGEFLAVLGREPVEDLVPGTTSIAWRQAVLAAWRSGRITALRSLELLYGSYEESDLPPREDSDQA